MDGPGNPIGRQVGLFRLEQKLGEGGMSCVYLARRIADFDQLAAVKIGLFEADHRFLTERQALAALQHPDIVRLIDGGITDDGLPYLAMEYVEGVPIDAHCGNASLSPAERVRMVIRILHAVHYAHQRLWIHCDLKFSNILVTPSGDPKILDFGIAKILDPERYGLTSQATRLGARPFTPEYASPEQLKGEPLSTATDIYSMGVVLYWLLRGVPPFHEFRDRPVAMMKAAMECEPEAVSPRVDALRGTVAGRDMDAILAKALSKSPEARYGTAAQFASDLENWIEGRPVEARRGARWYRFTKTVARNRAAVAAMALVVVLLLAGAGAAFWQGYRAATARTRARVRFDEVRKMTNELVFGLYEELNKLPDSAPARQSVIWWSVEHLNALSRQAGNDPLLIQDIADMYRRLADLAGPRDAFPIVAAGLTAIEPVLHQRPERKAALLIRGRLLAKRAALRAISGATGTAMDEEQAAIHWAASLAERYPRDYDILTNACAQHESYGDLLRQSGRPEADRAYAVAIQFNAAALRVAPGSDDGRRAQGVLERKLAGQYAGAQGCR